MSKITNSAKGHECQGRFDQHCQWLHESVVLAHRPGGGVARKTPDYQGAYLCQNCHDLMDGRRKNRAISPDRLLVMFSEAVWRTQELLREQKLLEVKK